MLDKELGRIKWESSAKNIHNLVRGIVPWPGAFTMFTDAPLNIWKTKPGPKPEQDLPVGSLQKTGDNISVVCGENGTETLQLLEVQTPSKAKMSAKDWANGAHIKTGDKFHYNLVASAASSVGANAADKTDANAGDP